MCVVQHAMAYEASTGSASLCLSPNSTCAAVALKRGSSMELQILDLASEDNATPDIESITNRSV